MPDFLPCISIPYERNNLLVCALSFLFGLCVFARFVVRLVPVFHCSVHKASLCLTCLTSPVYPMYIWFRDRCQLPKARR